MAQKTTLGPWGVSGQTYGSFVGKAAAAGKGAGPFTELGPWAVSSQRHTFVAKTPAGVGKGAGIFTRLHLNGVSGRNYAAWQAKTPSAAASTWRQRSTAALVKARRGKKCSAARGRR